MKRAITLLLSAVMAFSLLTGCSSDGQMDFKGTVKELWEGFLLVQVDSDQKHSDVKGEVLVSVGEEVELVDSEGNTISADAFEAGNRVVFTCDGEVIVSMPTMIASCTKVELLNE